ncbi:MAG TPA: hypothetical protein VGQ18_10745 [Gemmatimonadales bacterium]|jgi:hypothetical protein|nr:hypothetical protein [Gemmatimonadales bacterium]
MRARWFLLAALLPSSLAAQNPQTREGFWIGFGVGQGNLAWSCDGCTDQDHGGPTGFLRLGGTPSKKVLLGAELNFWSLDFGATEITAGYTAFTAYWYPSATGGLFLKGGFGGAIYTRKTAASEASSPGGALVLGAGYDIRVGQKLSITPMLSFWGSNKADLKDNGTTIETGFRHTGGTLQVGITFH